MTTLTFDNNFNQEINPEILSSNLKYINFNWIYLNENNPIEHYIEIINNIPSYYFVKILLKKNIFGVNGPLWPFHVINYEETNWSSKLYKVIDKYVHLIYGKIIIIINKETFQPYSHAKSAIK